MSAHIVTLVLAAGSSRRMPSQNKLLAPWKGKALLRHVTEQALNSMAGSVHVVTGYESERVAELLADLPVTLIHNPAHAAGMAGSLNLGVASLDTRVSGALVCLADMPKVRASHMNTLMVGFSPDQARDICIPTYHGRRGNPILIGRQLFPRIADIRGDIGARQLIRDNEDRVLEVPVPTPGILQDIDTVEELSRLRQD